LIGTDLDPLDGVVSGSLARYTALDQKLEIQPVSWRSRRSYLGPLAGDERSQFGEVRVSVVGLWAYSLEDSAPASRPNRPELLLVCCGSNWLGSNTVRM